jgi:hypothetical protein
VRGTRRPRRTTVIKVVPLTTPDTVQRLKDAPIMREDDNIEACEILDPEVFAYVPCEYW